jgi:hypothetical protein
MGKNVLRLLLILITAQSSYAAVFDGRPLSATVNRPAEVGSGDFHFYYYGAATWQWTFPEGGYTGVNFDPTDNLGDDWSNSYEVVYVDSLWNYDADGDYETTLYICANKGGVPDFDNPLYSYGPFCVPWVNGEWDSVYIDPPLPFYGGEIFWVLFSIAPENGRPITDGDGNSGHSWYSPDGYDWVLFDGYGGADWVQGVFADGLEVENVATESFGVIKVLYR